MNKVLQRKNENTAKSDNFLFINADKKMHRISSNDIYFLQGYGDYVKIHLTDELMSVHENLTSLQKKLPSDQFLRIHKSYIISLAKLDYVEGNRVKILNQMLPVSLTYRAEFFQKVKN